MQFLKHVANNLRGKFKNDLSRIAVVFPNKRAGIFFDDYLLAHDETTAVWAPEYLTISELFNTLSDFKPADDIRSVCLLYQIYKEKIQDAHISLDFFYGWGEQLLSDFSDIDRSLVDAHEIFGSWSAARQLETMTPEEREQLRPFIETLKGSGQLKEDFEHLWRYLYDIYKELNETLEADGEAYEGARQRHVIENLEQNQLTLPERFDKYAFVGFNMLLPVEWKLFELLQSTGKALFYWDYDRMYTGKGALFSFGKNMERNIERFPNELPENLFDNLSQRTTIEYVASSSDNAQAHYATSWLRQNLTRADEKRTAIVLCDETLLQPVIHSLPEDVKEVNITKGFPMSHTPAYAFVEDFFTRSETEKQPNPNDNLELLNKLSSALQQQAQNEMERHGEQSWLGQLTAESFFQCFTTVNRFKTFVSNGTLSVTRRTLQGLLRQVLTSLSVPFHGEPAAGLQIMGMLETRNLDFDQLLLLSVGDGIVPKKSADRSFIPYDLRKFYHIMTGDERSEVYAYNFFRLLQRSQHVTLVYNESTDGEKHCGEMSRFMVQILTETDIPVICYTLNEHNIINRCEVKGIDSETIRQIMENRRLNLSVSALEKFIDCPMKYFFSYMLGIKEIPQQSDLLPPNTFGSIFHRAAESIYEDLRGNRPEAILHADELSAMAGNIVKLETYIAEAFEYVSNEDTHSFSPTTKIEKDHQLYNKDEHEIEAGVIRDYLSNLLKYDAYIAKNNGLKFVHAEESLKADLDDLTSINGKIDRTDITHIDGIEKKRIIDYKTGAYKKEKMKAASIEELFSDNTKNYVLQTVFYELLYRLTRNETPVSAIYFLQKLYGKELSPYVTLGNTKNGLSDLTAEEKLDAFKSQLQQLIKDLRTAEYIFAFDEKACEHCKYALLCGSKSC